MKKVLRWMAVALAVSCVLNAAQAFAAKVTVAWDPPLSNTDGTPVTDITNYKLYMGTAVGTYTQTLEIGNATSRELLGLEDGRTYYCVATAINSLGNESAPSVELAFVAPDQTPPSITLPASMTVYAGADGKAAIPDLTQQAVVTDNLSPAGTIVLSQTPLAGARVGLGTTVVTVSAADQAGNTAQASVNVVVEDNTAPVLTVLTPTTTLTAGTDGKAAVPNMLSCVSVSDNCSASAAIVLAQTPASGSQVAVGTHSITIRATDASGNSAQTTVALVVEPRNQPPTVNAGTDATFQLPATQTTLSATATDDGLPVGSSLVLTWSKVSGPGAVVFADAHAAATTATIETAGVYVVRLTASDGTLETSDSVTITVLAAPVPTAPRNLRVVQ